MSNQVLYKDYFTPDEAADYCCVSPAYFYESIRPKVPSIALSERKILFRRADLQRFIENHNNNGNDRMADRQAGSVRVSKLVRTRETAS